jgi:hypothetical protein
MPLYRVTVRSQHGDAKFVLTGEFEELQDAIDMALSLADEELDHVCKADVKIELLQVQT